MRWRKRDWIAAKQFNYSQWTREPLWRRAKRSGPPLRCVRWPPRDVPRPQPASRGVAMPHLGAAQLIRSKCLHWPCKEPQACGTRGHGQCGRYLRSEVLQTCPTMCTTRQQCVVLVARRESAVKCPRPPRNAENGSCNPHFRAGSASHAHARHGGPPRRLPVPNPLLVRARDGPGQPWAPARPSPACRPRGANQHRQTPNGHLRRAPIRAQWEQKWPGIGQKVPGGPL